ncbi:MAG: DNA polymerase III subunit alpha, partial [Bacteroides fragilis]|nr:DNA polymerase III subunit alpha [Bacteroides fragilis]
IDVDYASDRRQEIKDYLEERYNADGRQRVFSAGTFTTMKLKAALKDVARVHRVPHSIVNYITAMIDDGTDWTGLFRQAASNRKLRDFIQTYPLVIEDVQGLLGQPKAASIHASAIVVTPDTRDGRPAECFDFLPVRKMDGALVSEFDGYSVDEIGLGYSVDEIGLLKEDVLATKELAKLSAVIALVNRNFGQELTIGRITQDMLEDGKTYRLLSDGNTQNVFQFSSPGITRFIQDVQPECIEDLIAVNALYRPATLDIGATDDYVRFRRGEVAPVYNYGCYEATKNTFGIMVYQEQFMSVAHTLGGFDLGKTDLLRKAIGKKKADLMATLKADFIAGAVGNGCPDY